MKYQPNFTYNVNYLYYRRKLLKLIFQYHHGVYGYSFFFIKQGYMVPVGYVR